MLRSDFTDLDDNGSQGDWIFDRNDTYLILRWGPNKDDLCTLPVKKVDGVTVPVWEWNGSKESPSLMPSILVWVEDRNNPKFHGYLENGKLRSV